MGKLSNRYCRRCGETVVAERVGPRHLLHLAMTILTAGIWLPAWLMAILFGGTYRCSDCGAKTYRSWWTAPNLVSAVLAIAVWAAIAYMAFSR